MSAEFDPLLGQLRTKDTQNLVYDVKDYGAIGDGSTNDTEAIYAAITAAGNAGWGIVYIPEGTYVVAGDGTASDGCFIVPNNVTVQGAGMGATVVQLITGTSSDVTGIFRTQFNTQNHDITIRDLTIDGNGANVTGTPRIIGFYCGTLPDSTTTDTDITCFNVEIHHCTGYGFDPHERTTRLRLINCISHDNGYGGNPYDGFTLDGNYDALVQGCISYNNNRYGFNLVTASNRCTVIGCEAYGNSGGGIALTNGAKYNEVIGNKFYNNSGDGIFVSGIPNTGTVIDNTQGSNNSIKGNIVIQSGSHGIHVFGSPNNHVSGNTVLDSSQTTTNTYSQIFLDDDSGSNLSTFNTVVDNGLQTTGLTNVPKYAIGEGHNTDDNNFWLGNRIAGTYGTANTNLLGTNSKLLAAHNGVNEHNSLLSLTPPDGTTIALGTSTGLQIGTATSQKLGFLGATPAIQQAASADLGSVLATFGLRATGGAYPLSTSATVQFTGPIRYSLTARTTGGTLTPGTSAATNTYDATSGSLTAKLAATATAGYFFTLKKIDSSANTITVTTVSGTGTIDGATSIVIGTQYESVTVMSTGTSDVWYVIGQVATTIL